MVEPLYRLMKALANVGHSLVSKLSNLFKIAVENHNRDIAVILVRLALEYRDVFLYNVRYEMLQAALQSGDVGLLLLLRPMWKEQHEFRLSINYDLNQADPAMIQLLYDANLVNPGRDMLKRALANREGNVLAFLVDVNVVTELNWNQLLVSVVTSGAALRSDRSFVTYLLTKTSAVDKNNALLRLAVNVGRHSRAGLVLLDPRVDPMENLRDILRSDERVISSIYDRVESSLSLCSDVDPPDNPNVMAILSDERVRIELLDLPTLRLALWWRQKYNNRIEDLDSCVLGQLLERGDLLALILRFILIQDPGDDKPGERILDWMISLGDQRLARVAAAMITPDAFIQRDLLPVYGLMLRLLYPNMLYRRVIRLLEEMVDDDELLEDCKILLSVWEPEPHVPLR